MRTLKHLFPTLCDPEHLDRALVETARGKRRRKDVAWFLFRRAQELRRIEEELRTLTWQPSGVDHMYIRDPKPRIISRAPFADRVVHAALSLLLEPFFLRSARPEAYACRPGLGTHRAVLRILELCRAHPFALHLDIRSYFPSVDLAILKNLLERSIQDPPFLEVLFRILDAGPTGPVLPPGSIPQVGLPIGFRTSQLLAAHVYLAALDQHVKRVLRVPGYVRYCDDLFLFGDHRGDLRRWRADVGRWLQEERHLRLKYPEAPILSCHGHLDALGHRVTRQGIGPMPGLYHRMERRAAAWIRWPRGRGAPPDLAASIAASLAAARFGA